MDSVFTLYSFLTYFSFTPIMTSMISKKYDKKLTKYVYHVSDIHYVPLFLLYRFIALVLFFVLLHYFAQAFPLKIYNGALADVFEDTLNMTVLFMYISLFVFCLYMLSEKLAKSLKLWNTFRHETAAKRMVYFIMFMNVVVVSLLYTKFKEDQFILDHIRIKKDIQPINVKTKGVFIGLVVVSFMNYIYLPDETKNTEFVSKITYIVAFAISLLFC